MRWTGMTLMILAACGPQANDDGTADEGSGSGDSTGSASQSDASATSAGTSGTTTATTSATTTSTTDATSATSAADTGGGPSECAIADDCLLFSDCCSCVAYPAGGEPPLECPADCEQGACEAAGIAELACNLGWCELAPVSCDQTLVACDALPPMCQDGWLPSVSGACWGPCVPAEACDLVPDCSWCTEEEICVTYGGIAHGTACEPVPAGCIGDGGVCLCEAICSDALSMCAVPDEGGIACTRTGG